MCSTGVTKTLKDEFNFSTMALGEKSVTYDPTMPVPAPANAIWVRVGTLSVLESWTFRKKRYEANTMPFINGTVVYEREKVS